VNPGLLPGLVHLVSAILSSRWGWLLLALPVLALGSFVVLNAHIIQPVYITGTVATYAEHTTLGTYDYHELSLVGSSQAYQLDARALHPAPPATLERGQHVRIWVEEGKTFILALALLDANGTQTALYTTQFYDHPADSLRNDRIGGGVILGIGAFLLLIALLWPLLPWGHPRQATTRVAPSSLRTDAHDGEPPRR
jgi:hypothetical protein